MGAITALRAEGMPIGTLSERSGVNIETIRYYERIKLFPCPPRTAGNQRVYDEAHQRRLTFIRRARELGFTIEDIRSLLALVDRHTATCGEVQSAAARQLVAVRTKIMDLRRLERALADMTASCPGGTTPECPILDTLFAGSVR
ncbi:helix-turn-helix domain-containing protein [Methylobacterium sp. 092160098-2]|jgi:MerR family mercuric resistance operon transcriptional regulator|uniref:MerR family transcriptional regulator n=1 Tax=Methylobacterium sp. 092160098-2 TaxID=3025129 RepID=UPI002381CC9D|nr:helix-turn-helix domain-containing protein [Methylobacterium sp. 092160098-2]MDE4915990.1 helix-turn-helix domain-containing protein [Methylobacterium sp. 092160098-2]